MLALHAPVAAAQTSSPGGSPALRDAVQKAIGTNPDVTARYHAFRASLDEAAVARGAYLPRVDLTAESVRQRDAYGSRVPPDASFGSDGMALNVTQLLWDGLATRSEVATLDHARLTRWFEFVDASEQAALEAVRAYDDVLRYRRLVQFAEDSYVQHKLAHEQLRARFKAGVGRGVDLEQAAARLALAESNLSAEQSNLHDVSERYRRIVGETPPASMPVAGPLANTSAADRSSVVERAGVASAAVAAAVENLRAARAQARNREAAYQPRVEARVRTGAGHNFDGIQDQKRNATAGVYLTWNLFNGGSDVARTRQYQSLIEQASDQRDRACRDARQTAAVAFNDEHRLREQIAFLDRNVIAIEKARDAYRQQFEIGQRSLLDLLNAENELYTARRAYANAEFDLGIAQARVLASTSSLAASLGLARAAAAMPSDADAAKAAADAAPSDWSAGADAAAQCPVEPLADLSTPKSELDARANRLMTGLPSAR